ncbi:MAG: SpoVR family protein [Planctomycetota bacterium]|nr:SpoVR family protein [Planctomycetota bacterium]
MIATELPPDLVHQREEIKGYCADAGLDFFETIFEMVDYKKMNELASLGGFPTRYPHWNFGMEYDRLEKSYSYGLHKIYEMVINNDPCYAYLLNCNKLVDQKLVIAHVYAHCDFFKNNLYFAHTNRKMVDEMANHSSKVWKFVRKHGYDEVEEFLDRCLSIDNLIDLHSVFFERRENQTASALDAEETETPSSNRFSTDKSYLDKYINPPEVIAEQKRKEEEAAKEEGKKYPPEPVQDVLLFLIEHAPLNNWQSDILSMIREEAYYFAPQGQTKIMNEGWATYWHSKIMTGKALTDAEVIDFADHHSGTVHATPNQMNPYKIGVELMRDIEERWNTGRFGKEFEECEDLEKKRNWNTDHGKGREKIFEVRRVYNDIGFLDTFLTQEFCREQKLFVYGYNDRRNAYEIQDREFKVIKQQILMQLTNMGSPFIFVEDANHKNRGELFLRHRHDGIDLRKDYAADVLKNIHAMWTRPVHIGTEIEERTKIISFDGNDYHVKDH